MASAEMVSGDILTQKYPAKAHALAVAEQAATKLSDSKLPVVLALEGQKSELWPNCDQERPFRQDRSFFYLSGCDLPNCHIIYEYPADKLTLYLPTPDPDEVIWSGLPLSAEQALKKYDVDEVLFTEDYKKHLETTLALANQRGVKHILETALRSGHQQTLVASLGGFAQDLLTEELSSAASQHSTQLREIIDECRVVKDAYEIALIRRANEISEKAHIAVMKGVKRSSNEEELAGIFLQQCTAGGAPKQAYDSIVASGESASTLHYVKNDASLKGKQLLLLDAGCESRCYASDVTRTYPINGQWTKEARSVYDLVLKMQTECIEMTKAGVKWEDVHLLAHKIAREGLEKLGLIVKGDGKAPEDLTTAFLPHGLGHYMGMDTHDTGGHANYKDTNNLFRYLRVRGALPAGSVITVEPGIYFCRPMLDRFLIDDKYAKYIDKTVLESYWAVGGVRIEDNILVTEHGAINLTSVPKDPEELVKIINE